MSSHERARPDLYPGRRPRYREQDVQVTGSSLYLSVLIVMAIMLTLGTGRTNIPFGLVHVVVFAVFLFLVFVP